MNNTGQASLSEGVLLGKGDGTFQPQVTFPAGNFPYGVTVGDFNGDGLPDIAAANYNDGTATIFLSQADGDLDGDGDPTGNCSGGGDADNTGHAWYEVVASYPGDAHYVLQECVAADDSVVVGSG